jgi:hypothetical protein
VETRLENEFVIDVFLICVFFFSFPRYLALFIISGWEFSVARRVGFIILSISTINLVQITSVAYLVAVPLSR